MILGALLSAASDSGSIDVTSLIAPILSTGVVGVVLIMLIFEIGFITKKSAEREREAMQAAHERELQVTHDQVTGLRADVAELKHANGSLQELTRERMIPALVQATEVSRAYVAELARRNDRRGDDG